MQLGDFFLFLGKIFLFSRFCRGLFRTFFLTLHKKIAIRGLVIRFSRVLRVYDRSKETRKAVSAALPSDVSAGHHTSSRHIFAHLLDDSKELKEETAEHYLLTCVRNRCLNMIRSRKIQERVEHLYLLDLDTTILPTERLEEELKALYKGIDQLEPPVCRDIIMQHFRDGITFKEIANRLGVSETTVYKHLRRALHQLRTHLNNK